MESGKLIEMIKESDPEGTTQVTLGGDAVWFVERLPGYYDGSFAYLENDNKFVVTDKGDIDKVIINPMGLEDFLLHTDCKGEVVPRFRDKQRNHEYKREVETIIRKFKSWEEKSIQQYTFQVLSKIKEGFQIRQSSKDKIGLYNCMSYQKPGFDIDTRLCQGECGAVLKSGFFEPLKQTEYVYWVPIFTGTIRI